MCKDDSRRIVSIFSIPSIENESRQENPFFLHVLQKRLPRVECGTFICTEDPKCNLPKNTQRIEYFFELVGNGEEHGNCCGGQPGRRFVRYTNASGMPLRQFFVVRNGLVTQGSPVVLNTMSEGRIQ